MKKLGIVLIICLMTAFVHAQNTAVDKLFDKYSEIDGFTTVYVSKNLFNLVAEMESEDEEMHDVMSKLEKIRILAADDCWENPDGVNFYDEVMETLPREEYEELLVVKEKDQDVIFLIKEADGIISELLLVVGGEDNALISILGDIDIRKVHTMAKSMHGGPFHHLQKLKEYDR